MLWWDDDVKKNQVKPPDIDSKILNSSLFLSHLILFFPPFFIVHSCFQGETTLIVNWDESIFVGSKSNHCITLSLTALTHWLSQKSFETWLMWLCLIEMPSQKLVLTRPIIPLSLWSAKLIVMVMVWSVLEKNFSSGWLERSQQSLSYICTGPFSHGDKRTSKRSTSWT